MKDPTPQHRLRVIEMGQQVSKHPHPHHAKAIYLSCIDYRFVDATVRLVEQVEQCQCTDSFCLAGATLGNNKFTHWRQAFRDNLNIAVKLHDINTVIFVEHMDCGAYRVTYGQQTPEAERRLHISNVAIAANWTKRIHPQITTIRGYLFHVDGTAEKIY